MRRDWSGCSNYVQTIISGARRQEKSDNMFSRGGRLSVALLSRQLTAQARPIATTSFLQKGEVVRINRETASRRNYSTEVMGGLEEQRRILRNRILYRSKQRGYLELDLLLGKWAQENIIELDDAQLGALVELLDEENPDLWKWLSGQDNVPEKMASNPVFTAIHKHVSKSLDDHASAETRARPGAPWVRGWDDIAKGGTPNIGNQ